jgi:hypothetical protein
MKRCRLTVIIQPGYQILSRRDIRFMGKKYATPIWVAQKTVDCYKGLMPLRYFAGWLALMVNFG